jgi:homoserine kinase type II
MSDRARPTSWSGKPLPLRHREGDTPIFVRRSLARPIGQCVGMPDDQGALSDVLDLLGYGPRRISTLKDLPFENASWLVEVAGDQRFVLRRYHDRATFEDLAYEHSVLGHLGALGWVVPHPVGELVCHEGAWWCPTRYVPGHAVRDETPQQRRQRGHDLARVDLALRGLGERLGQRPGWQAQHRGVTVHSDIVWDDCLRSFSDVDRRLAVWADRAALEVRARPDALGVEDLPETIVHGDFAEWNVHYEDNRLAGIIDFGLTHLDSRPYELAIARTYRSPEAIVAYRDELARSGWPLTELEEASIEAIHQAFRVDMVAWQLDLGQRTGTYDLAMIERQLARAGTAPP